MELHKHSVSSTISKVTATVSAWSVSAKLAVDDATPLPTVMPK